MSDRTDELIQRMERTLGAVDKLIASIEQCGETARRINPNKQHAKRGRWECVRSGWYKCSCCGRELQSYSGMDTAKYYPYCHCGAKMQDVGYSEMNKYHSICESLEKNGSADMRGEEE